MADATKPGGASPGPVAVRLRFAGAEDFVRQVAADAALGGVVIATHVPQAVGTQLDLTADFGPGGSLRAIAEVVWVRPAGAAAGSAMGVRLVQMAPAHQAWLKAALAALAAPPAAPAAQGAERHMLRRAQGARSLEGSLEALGAAPAEAWVGPVVGIDLGTSNCCACVVLEGEPTVVELGDPASPSGSARTLPSVVAYDDGGRVVVGHAALAQLPTNPRRTIFGAKRLVGRAYDSAAVQSMLGRFPFKVVPGAEGRAAIEVNGRPVALTTISAKLLQAIRERTEAQLKQSVRRAVITVPAYYSDSQRSAVVQAGRLAGLQVERILNEPTAAAIAYGLLRSRPRRLLVYDLGGGTFDVSVMSVHKDHLQVLATAGDTFLGGEDFDDVLVKMVQETFFRSSGRQLSGSAQGVAVLRAAVEPAKRRLSGRDEVMVTLRDAPLADGTSCRVEVPLTRAAFEGRIEPLVQRTLKICDMALREAQLQGSQLGDVILVGGQTRMPYVQQRVRDHFKQAPRCDLDPDEVVALGAGLLPHLPKRGAGDAFVDVLSMSIGVAVAGRFKSLLPRNVAVPTSRRVRLHVGRAAWATYGIDIWQGDAELLHRNELLGTLRVDAVEAGPQDPVPIELELALSADCLLKARLTNLATGQGAAVLLQTRDADG